MQELETIQKIKVSETSMNNHYWQLLPSFLSVNFVEARKQGELNFFLIRDKSQVFTESI